MMDSFSVYSFVTGLMLGILVTGAYFLGGADFSPLSLPSTLPLATSTESAITAPDTAQETSGALSVADQVAGDTAVIESVTVPPPGVWIAIREVNGDDTLGNTLGAARVTGPRTNVPVSLLRATQAGNRYAAELYRDDNNGAFDPSVNSVYVDFDTGMRVVAYFRATE